MRTPPGARPLAVVTGASRGIGLALAEELATRAYDLVVSADDGALDAVAAGLREEVASSGVTVTALMPGATDTGLFERAGMQDTRVGQARKDDPATVAREAIDAMLAGRDHVVTGSAKNKLVTAAAKVLPSQVRAKASARLTEPGGAG